MKRYVRSLDRLLVGTVISFAFGQAAYAEVFGDAISDSEMGLIPSYCRYTQTFPGSAKEPSIYQGYVERYGTGWTHMHHYCWALLAMARYDRPGNDRQTKNALARGAVADLNYVLRNAPAEFAFRFDVLTRKGKALIRNGQLKEARAVSEAVLNQWPDRADSYALAAELEWSSNRRGELSKLFELARPKVRDLERLEQIRAVYQESESRKRQP